MKSHSRFCSLLLTALLAFSNLSCGNSTDSLIEAARFHLDRYEYVEALALGEQALAQSPSHSEAKFVIALALVGTYYLGPDRTNLHFLAELTRDLENGKGLFKSFLRSVQIDSATAYEKVTGAQDILLTVPDAERGLDVWLEIYLVRLFEIGLALEAMGVFSGDEICNANSSNPKRDLVPDALNPGNLTSTQADRFDENLENIWRDAGKAGLGDLEITRQVKAVWEALEDAISSAGDLTQGLDLAVRNAFDDDGTEAICIW